MLLVSFAVQSVPLRVLVSVYACIIAYMQELSTFISQLLDLPCHNPCSNQHLQQGFCNRLSAVFRGRGYNYLMLFSRRCAGFYNVCVHLFPVNKTFCNILVSKITYNKRAKKYEQFKYVHACIITLFGQTGKRYLHCPFTLLNYMQSRFQHVLAATRIVVCACVHCHLHACCFQCSLYNSIVLFLPAPHFNAACAVLQFVVKNSRMCAGQFAYNLHYVCCHLRVLVAVYACIITCIVKCTNNTCALYISLQKHCCSIRLVSVLVAVNHCKHFASLCSNRNHVVFVALVVAQQRVIHKNFATVLLAVKTQRLAICSVNYAAVCVKYLHFVFLVTVYVCIILPKSKVRKCYLRTLQSILVKHKAQALCFLRYSSKCNKIVLHPVCVQQCANTVLFALCLLQFHKAHIRVLVAQQHSSTSLAVSVTHVNHAVQSANAHEFVSCCVCHFVFLLFATALLQRMYVLYTQKRKAQVLFCALHIFTFKQCPQCSASIVRCPSISQCCCNPTH